MLELRPQQTAGVVLDLVVKSWRAEPKMKNGLNGEPIYPWLSHSRVQGDPMVHERPRPDPAAPKNGALF